MTWYLGIGLVVVMVILFALGVVADKERSLHRWRSGGYLFFLLKRMLFGKMGLWEVEQSYYKEIYVNERPEHRQCTDICQQGIYVLGIGLVLGIALLVMTHLGFFTPTLINEVSRPENGTSTNTLIAQTENETFSIAVAVTERQLTAVEIQQIWSEARTQLETWILGSNSSTEQVTTDLDLINSIPGTPVSITWYSSDYSLVNYEGKVDVTKLVELNQQVNLTAELSYGDWEETVVIPIYVTAEELSTREASRAEIHEALVELIDEQLYEDTIILPSEIAERSVRFYREPEQTPGILVALAIISIVGIFAAMESNRKKQKEMRKHQLQLDYPEVVSKLTLLMEAGMTIRLAWEKIISDYQKYYVGRCKYAYEEMILTYNQMQIGVPEEKAYQQFGKRCGSILYLRFSSVLVQNLQKGTKSILPLLKKEAEEARLERKEHARQLGEEAGTKLLLPMAGMLILVLVIVMIPAFLSF